MLLKSIFTILKVPSLHEPSPEKKISILHQLAFFQSLLILEKDGNRASEVKPL
jgi:hypothetical protein